MIHYLVVYNFFLKFRYNSKRIDRSIEIALFLKQGITSAYFITGGKLLAVI